MADEFGATGATGASWWPSGATGATGDDTAAPVAPVAPEPEKKPDTLVGVLVELFQFNDERTHRERQMEPADAPRLTNLMNRLRALDK